MKVENEINCLYRLFDENQELLYVGISMHVMARIHDHAKHKDWFSKVSTIKIERFNSRKEVEEAEKAAIKNEKPKHNVMHSDITISYDEIKNRKSRQRKLFSEKFSDYVESTGKTWFECAYELGICHTAISRWKSGRICPSMRTIKRIERWSNGAINAAEFNLNNF